MSDYSDLELQEQLMNQLEEMQTEIEQYRQTITDLQAEVSQKDSQALEAVEQAESFSKELERTQSELMNTKKKYSLALSNLEKLNSQLEQARQSANSSQVQELVSTVQQQKKKIAEQAELIEKLNESDLIVKENDRLKKLNSDLQKSEQNARQEAMTEVSAIKEECAKRERIAESKAQEADKLKSHLEAVETDLSGQIDKKALNLVESKLNALQGAYEAKQRSLDSKYKALTVSHEVILFGCLLYGILVTVFTAVRSKAFTGDFKTFFITVGNFFTWCGKSLYWLGIQASKLGDMIPQPIVATIVHWILFIIACFGVAIVLVILAFTGIYAWFEWFKENQADLVALSVFLVSLALIIFFADVFKAFLPVNLLLLLLLVQIIAMLARVGYKQYRKSKGYYY